MASVPSSERKIACNACRRRKTACDRSRPRCSLCRKGNFECEYADNQRQPPGLRAGYVHQLEQRIDHLERRLYDVESHLQVSAASPIVENGNLRARSDAVTPPFQHSPDDFDPSNLQQVTGTPEGAIHTAQASTQPRYHIDERIEDLAARNEACLVSLPESAVSDLCKYWFQKYHRWFPILHQPSFMHELAKPGNGNGRNSLVVQAIVAITAQHSPQFLSSSGLTQEWRDQLCASIVMDCFQTTSLQSVQALLILSVLHYGNGQGMKSWNLLAMSRRIGAHLGLGGTVETDGPTAASPTALRRLPTFINTVVAHEEKIRAHYMIATLDSISTIGARYEVSLPNAPGNPLLPCSDSFWACPETVMNENHIRPYHYCSAFSLCVILAVSELSIVHRFLQRTVNMSSFEERDTWQSEAQQIDERLTAWRDEFVAAVFRLINAEYAHHERPEMDAYVVLTNCVLNSAVITLLQQRAPCPDGIEKVAEPWTFATNRCVYACENTAFKVRQMDEDEMLICHPHLIFSIFIAARFYIVYSKAVNANVPTNLHSLAFALHTCGKSWRIARLYEHIIRIAVSEYRTPIASSRVPRDFYDLRLTTFEINDALITWAEGPGAEITLAVDSGNHSGVMTFTPMAIDTFA